MNLFATWPNGKYHFHQYALQRRSIAKLPPVSFISSLDFYLCTHLTPLDIFLAHFIMYLITITIKWSIYNITHCCWNSVLSISEIKVWNFTNPIFLSGSNCFHLISIARWSPRLGFGLHVSTFLMVFLIWTIRGSTCIFKSVTWVLWQQDSCLLLIHILHLRLQCGSISLRNFQKRRIQNCFGISRLLCGWKSTNIQLVMKFHIFTVFSGYSDG